MKVDVIGNKKVTKKYGKKFTNIQARFPTSCELCNETGIRVGDIARMKINDNSFESKVSDYITVPYRLVFSDKEIEQIKNGESRFKDADIEIVDIIKNNPSVRLSDSLIAVLAHAYSDGSISPTTFHYTNTDRELIDQYKSLIKDCFPNDKFREWKDGKIIHIQMEAMGPVSVITRFIDKFGRKSITNPYVPTFIKNNNNFSGTWLRHTFADEGWVNTNGKIVSLIRCVRFKNEELIKNLNWIEMESGIKKSRLISYLDDEQLKLIPRNNLIDDEAEMLKNLGVPCKVYLRKRVELIKNSISATYELNCKGKDFIKVGFCCMSKQKQLKKLVNN